MAEMVLRSDGRFAFNISQPLLALRRWLLGAAGELFRFALPVSSTVLAESLQAINYSGDGWMDGSVPA